MKNKILIISLLIANLVFCQSDFKNKHSLYFNPNFPIALGNNFLNKAYSNNVGIAIEYQYSFKSFFLGLNYEFGNESISDKNLMGNFQSSSSYSVIWFLGFRQKLENKKRYLEYKIGSGTKTINNLTNINEHKIYGNSWVLGSKYNYAFSKKAHFTAGLEYRYTCYDVIIDGPYKDFYTVSHQFTPSVGIKLFL